MKILAFYLTLLIYVHCGQGDFVSNSSNLNDTKLKNKPNYGLDLVASSVETCQALDSKRDFLNSINRKEQDDADLVPRPKLVVTFLANTKEIDNGDSFGGAGSALDPPLFLDPFQRLLQFFFSSFTRDFTPKEEKPDRIVKFKDADNSNITDLDWLLKKEEPSNPYCQHGLNGFCRSCHMISRNTLDIDHFKTKRDKFNNTNGFHVLHGNSSKLVQFQKGGTEPKSKREHNRNLRKLISIYDTPRILTQSSTKKTETPRSTSSTKESRHYFLSISGDTDKRVTASKQSDNSRIKRQSAHLGLGKDNQSFFKILEETIFESLNKNKGLVEIESAKTKERREETSERGQLAPTTQKPRDTSNDNEYDTDDLPDNDLYDFGISPHAAEYSHGWTYFFLVTLPVTCTFIAIVIFLCICMRTRGWCCRLFLKDPALAMQEQKVMRKAEKKKRKNEPILA